MAMVPKKRAEDSEVGDCEVTRLRDWGVQLVLRAPCLSAVYDILTLRSPRAVPTLSPPW